MARTTRISTAPTTLSASGLTSVSVSLTSVRPIAVPAALNSAVSSAAIPIATNQPKKAAPKLKPPYSPRCRSLSTIARRGRRSSTCRRSDDSVRGPSSAVLVLRPSMSRPPAIALLVGPLPGWGQVKPQPRLIQTSEAGMFQFSGRSDYSHSPCADAARLARAAGPGCSRLPDHDAPTTNTNDTGTMTGRQTEGIGTRLYSGGLAPPVLLYRRIPPATTSKRGGGSPDR